MNNINSFSGEYEFLSNFFYPTYIEYEGIIYSTVEHAFQAAKTLDLEAREKIADLSTPGQAKRYGRKVNLRDDWEKIKIDVMRELLKLKFSDHELSNMLIETRGKMLIEGNHWHDTFWGVCNGKGQNVLGKLLMEIRDEKINKI